MKSELSKTYFKVLGGLKEKIRQAQVRASLTVNTQLLHLYWEIGYTIFNQEKSEGWGAKIVERLAVDLRSEFPDIKGLSPRNLRYMRDFYSAYPGFSILQVPPAKLPITEKNKKYKMAILQQAVAKSDHSEILQQLVAKLPWAHNLILLDRVKSAGERIFYAQKAIENCWSRNILAQQIESKLYVRQGKAITNFKYTLPSSQSDMATEIIKNPYIFDFLGLSEEVKEHDLEKALLANLKKFLLELGKGFAYVGNQFNISVEEDDYFLDLLFYNYNLHCFVVFELKIKDFKPEFVGKLNFYINTVDEQIKNKEHKPTIGILLCKTPNKTVIEYSLRGFGKPMGVSDYQLSKVLPEKLERDLPTVEELERELEKEMREYRENIKTGKIRENKITKKKHNSTKNKKQK